VNRVLNFFSLPYPGNSGIPRNVLVYTLVGVFVTFFLYLFQPFNLHAYTGNKLLLSFYFGLITLVFGLVYFLFGHFVLKIRQDVPSWTFGKWLIYIFLLFNWIAFGNFMLSEMLLGDGTFQWYAYFNFLPHTIAVGIFPVAFVGTYQLWRNDKRNKAAATQVKDSGKHFEKEQQQVDVFITAESGDDYAGPATAVLFIEAEENYIAVVTLVDGELRRTLVRQTLSQSLANLPPRYFMRCHRSFIVHLPKITSVEGNAQGLVLGFDGTDVTIPVSRSYFDSFNSSLK
jgi:hypothetical protein